MLNLSKADGYSSVSRQKSYSTYRSSITTIINKVLISIKESPFKS